MCQMCGEQSPKGECYVNGKKTARNCMYKCKKCKGLRSRMQRMLQGKEPTRVD